MLRTLLMLALVGTVTVLAGPVAVNRSDAANSVEETVAVTQEVPAATTSVAPESASSNEVTDTSAAVPATETTVAVVESSSSSSSAPVEQTSTTAKPRKTITFDQRQQGKFNIRADLENFVIVVVPSSPSAGISLLDLLNRSGQKHHQKKKAVHRKGVKNGHGGVQKKTPPSTAHEVVVLDESQSHARVDNEEFIEGRTPYKVDISSTARSSNADLPSPIYRVMRPFNFNVEQPTSSSNMIRFPSASGNYPGDGDGGTVRAAKSLPANAAATALGDDDLRTNTVYAILTNNNNNDNNRGDGIDRFEDDAGGNQAQPDNDNYLSSTEDRTYLDLPAFHPDSSFDSLEQYPRSDVDMTKLQLQEDNQQHQQQQQEFYGEDQVGEDGWELKLLGAQEQCGPDRKRDSYGVCQFVSP